MSAQPATPADLREADDLVRRLQGRVDFLRNYYAEVKTPDLLQEAVDRIVKLSAALAAAEARNKEWEASDAVLRLALTHVCRVHVVDDQHPEPDAATSRTVAYYIEAAQQFKGTP